MVAATCSLSVKGLLRPRATRSRRDRTFLFESRTIE
jgi:hypothetical protein